MSRLKVIILIELALLAVVGGVLWYLFRGEEVQTVAVVDPSQIEADADMAGVESWQGELAALPASPGDPGAPVPSGDGALKLAGQRLPVPSGLDVMVWDRIEEEDGAVRYRFVAPGIAEGSAGEGAADDMQVLCDGFVVFNLPDPANPPTQVIITLMEKPIELGDSRPDVVQFFEAFALEGGKCVWEMF